MSRALRCDNKECKKFFMPDKVIGNYAQLKINFYNREKTEKPEVTIDSNCISISGLSVNNSYYNYDLDYYTLCPDCTKKFIKMFEEVQND